MAIFALKTHLNRFSAPARNISSLLISMLSLERLLCNLPRHVAALGSEPCKQEKKMHKDVHENEVINQKGAW